MDAAIATNAVLGVVMPQRLRHRRRRVLADLGRGRRAPARAERVGPECRRRSTPRRCATAVCATLPRRGPLSITVPGAVRSWGDAHARFGRLSRDEVLAPAIELARAGFPAWDGFINAVEATCRARRRGARHRTPASRPSTGRTAAPWRARRARPPAGPRRHARDARPRRVRRLLRRRPRRAPGPGAGRGRLADPASRTCASTPRPGASRSRSTTAGSGSRPIRRTAPASSPSSCSACSSAFEPPQRRPFGPEGVTDARWIHLHLEAAKLAMADRDAYLTDPAARDVPVETLLDRERLAALAARHRPDAGQRARRPRPTRRGGGTIFLATVDADGNAVSLIESNYMGFGSGVVDPATGDPLPEPGQLLQPGPRPPERPRAAQADAPHAAPRDAVPGRVRPARGSSPARWAATPSRRSTPSS